MKNYARKSNWVRGNCIGKGSFGVVSIGVDNSDGAVFAVKSVENSSGGFIGCLENEIRILKSLSSPYVVTYLGDDLTCEFSSVYRNLHMEYMPGGTVSDVAGEHVRSYTRCITSALSYIHARGIVHCDVKGKNVLIGNTPGTAKLADFGSAIELGSPVTGTRGSPLWMAPEVIRGEYQGPESDVWSLGCTVIEILTGKPAWRDRGADTLRQIGYSDDLPEITVPLTDDLRDFINKCLRRDRNERWSCDQLLHHPFLLSCSPPSPPQITINTCKFSPRCVFDWSASSSSNESTIEIHQFDTMNSEAKQRIGKLASTSGANWESEGWEIVRNATTLEYSDSIDYEESVSGSERANSEYAESNASYNYDLESTTNDARGLG
ncbi:hypothetical protein LXL04_036580 [Taraxacum kok-saghyz]